MWKFRLAVLMLFAAFHSHAVTVWGQAETTVERLVVPFVFDGVNPCNEEAVLLTGELKVTIRTTVDGRDRTHVALTLVPSGVRGEGASGTEYRAVGAQREHVELTESPFFVDSFTSVFNLVSQGSTDNFRQNTVFHLTITADGTVRSDVERFSERCQG
jgi:hypothetical protein